jgi:DNA-binding NarL/FixJ family response regulator
MLITVSIVEDHAGTREGLVQLFGASSGPRCVGAYASAEQAVRGIPIDRPDVALVDINLPGMSGIGCVAELKSRMPGLLVLMLTRFETADLIFKALRAGASGYLLKKMPPGQIVEAVVDVYAGGAPMSAPIARKVIDHFHHTPPVRESEPLTKKEEEVLALLSQGFLYKQISDQLGISLNTVREHVRNVYRKLHVQSRAEAMRKFLGHD